MIIFEDQIMGVKRSNSKLLDKSKKYGQWISALFQRTIRQHVAFSSVDLKAISRFFYRRGSNAFYRKIVTTGQNGLSVALIKPPIEDAIPIIPGRVERQQWLG